MILFVQPGDDPGHVERRRHRDAGGGEPAIAGRGVDGVEALPQPVDGLGISEAAGGIIDADLGLARRARLDQIVDMLDRAEAGPRDRLDGQRIRRVRGGEQAAPVRRLDRIEEDFGAQRIVGDLDEVDVLRLQAIERGVDLGRAVDLDRAGPDRMGTLELRARREDPRPEQAAVGGFAPPAQHLLGQVGGAVAHRGDAVSQIDREQCAILGGQRLAAAEMDVHVPQAGHGEGAGRVHRARRRETPGDLRIGPLGDDIVAANCDRALGGDRARGDIDGRRVPDQQVDRLGRLRGRAEQQGEGRGEAGDPPQSNSLPKARFARFFQWPR